MLKVISVYTRSEKPVVRIVKCTVPNCDKRWWLEGPRQGFQKAAALRHAYAHWWKYHLESKHSATHIGSCSLCIKQVNAGKKEAKP